MRREVEVAAPMSLDDRAMAREVNMVMEEQLQ